MTSKLIQKQLFKGTREFEIVDDAVKVRIKSRFKEETFSVMLAVLNAEPVITRSHLEFTSRVNNEPLLSLQLAKPNAEVFNDFVNRLKQKALDEYNSFAGLKSLSPEGLKANVFEEPPEFDTPQNAYAGGSRKVISAESIASSIQMLSEYVGGSEIAPLLAALEAIQTDPGNAANLSRLATEFDALGPSQGAVLTYAPYIGILLSDDPFEP